MLFDILWDKISAHTNRNEKKKTSVPAIHITDKASARMLFRRYSGNEHLMKKNCDEATMELCHALVGSTDKRAWAEELCSELLEAIATGNTSVCEAFQTVNSLMDRYMYEPLTELYTKAWFAVLDTPEPLVGCISKYLELYPNRFSAEHAVSILPLLDRTEAYLQKHDPQKLKQSRYNSPEGNFRELCAEIRRIARESTVTESRFAFVKTPPDTLDIIRDTLMEKYNDVDTVREETVNLNCAYGVQFEDCFLTASNAAANMPSLRRWDILEFMAVLFKERKAVPFRCVRNDDGSFGIDPHYIKHVKAYEPLLTEAVAAYRNIPARRKFENTLDTNDMSACREQYLSQFPKIMRDVYARIPDCSITEALRQMVDYAEDAVSEYGSKRICFEPPADKEKIADWERQHVRLPKQYRQFLQFANGVSLPPAIEFFGLSDIDCYKKYLDQEGYTAYHHIGFFIGDGTCLCFSEKDDLFYEWQDGEMNLMGDFDYMVAWVCDL